MVLAILFRTQDFMGWLSRLTTIPKLSALRCNQCLLNLFRLPIGEFMRCHCITRCIVAHSWS